MGAKKEFVSFYNHYCPFKDLGGMIHRIFWKTALNAKFAYNSRKQLTILK
ncbi:hypothetical protein HMPREF3190_00745 [Umbribacter vaginalis]|nr:hypothetical protein HMPREF3190_00745 [Coriobacteriales bacterium DNF00809]